MKISSYILIFLLSIQIVNAIEYKQEFYLQDKETNVKININYDKESNFDFYLDLPRDVSEIKVYFDDKEKKFQVRKAELINFVNIFGQAKNIQINYNSEYYIEHSSKYYFTAEITPVISGNLEIKVILPEGATLDKPYSNQGSNSVYPRPSKLESNGKNLIIIWEETVEAYSPFALFLVYNYQTFNYLYILIGLLLIVAILFSIFKIMKKRKTKVKTIKSNNIDKHLKEDEKFVVNILKKRKGKCTQSTLLTLTNMSKASLSRLLLELENRKIIRKEQQGNKNLIILKRR